MSDYRYAVIDVSSLAYRCWFAAAPTLWRDQPFMLFTFLRNSCMRLQDELCVDTLAFCFDGGYDYRKEKWPDYKKPRKERTAGDDHAIRQLREMFFDQIRAFRENHLPMIGVKNVFWQQGFEADDLIAACVRSLSNAKKVYVVSSDEDLYQLIEGNRVVLYKPQSKEVFNEEDFRRTHQDMPPCLYASAKAWAGCNSDNIEGLPGIGMQKAAKFMLGKGTPKSRQFFTDNVSIYLRNIELTKLPAPGTNECKVMPQETPIGWDILETAFKSATQTPRGLKR